MRFYVSLLNSSYLRNLEPVVRLLLERGHHVTLGFVAQTERESYLQNFVDSVGTDRLSITSPPQRPVDRQANWLHWTVDYLFFLGQEFDKTPYSRLKKAQKLRGFVRRLIKRYRLRYGWRRKAMLAWLRLVEESIPADARVLDHLRYHRPELLLVTPLLGSRFEQLEHMRAAKALRIPTIYAVHSWDNLTSKGLIRMHPEGITVWNEVQAREAVELHRQQSKRVFITGAYNFDDWFEATPSADRTTFLRRVGLPGDRAVILYLCSALFFQKAQPEEDFIVEWLARLRQSSESRLREAAVLVRPHPKRLEELGDLSIFDCDPAVVVWPLKGELPAGRERKQAFFDSIYHADAVVALNTTAMIDAAIVGRPVHTVLDERHRFSQDMTIHFNYLTDPEIGVLRVAHSWDAHFRQLSESLASGHNTDRVKNFVENFVRPQGLDHACAPKFADYIESLARGRKVVPLPGIWLRAITLPWAKVMDWRVKRAERRVNWKSVQSPEDWQQRRLFLDGLRLRAKA